MAKRPNPNLAKIHRCYTVEEVATLFGIHKNTVRKCVKDGLATNDDKRPMLIRGSDLKNTCSRKGRAINKNALLLKSFALAVESLKYLLRIWLIMSLLIAVWGA